MRVYLARRVPGGDLPDAGQQSAAGVCQFIQDLADAVAHAQVGKAQDAADGSAAAASRFGCYLGDASNLAERCERRRLASVVTESAFDEDCRGYAVTVSGVRKKLIEHVAPLALFSQVMVRVGDL
jgi:hypothetical protein